METRFTKQLIALFAVIVLSFLVGCKDTPVEPETTEPATDQAAMEKIADEDSSISSFEPSYNEDDVMDFLGKTNTPIYPRRVGHKVRLVNKNFNVNIQGDTAYGTFTKTFEGVLLIAATYDSTQGQPDTLIQKPFTAQVKRNLIFVKVRNTDRPYLNWRLAAISLPEGGTINTPNIDITKLTVFLPNGNTLEITSPNDYYLARGFGWWRALPIVPRNDSVVVQVELFSAYEEEDFVTLTWGAHRDGHHRAKRKFDLVSSTPSGAGFDKVYQQTFRTNSHVGHYHAIINAFPKQVIFDDAAPVESNMWGIPYFVRP